MLSYAHMRMGYLTSLFLLLLAAIGVASIIDTDVTFRGVPEVRLQPEASASTTPATTAVATSTRTAPASTTPQTKTEQPKATTTSPTAPPRKPTPIAPTTTRALPAQPPTAATTDALPIADIDASSLNTLARSALVNIYCEADPLSLLPSTIGSGMLIDPRGIILTNAHVAEYLLLESYRVPKAIQCYARNGSPARIAYKVNLLYLPPTWIADNAPYITKTNTRRAGLGKNDFALLYITESATDEPLPTSFPYIPLEYTDPLQVGDDVFAVAYPAELLPDRNKLNALYPVSAYSKIEYFITFTEDILDELYLSGNAVSQTGASGGGVLTTGGRLYAVIATVTDGATPQDRDFQAITIPYISRTLKELTGQSLSTFLSNDPNLALSDFRTNTAPALTAALTAEYLKVHQQ